MNSCDYAIVGCGAAGSVLANRLSADPRNSVIVVEAGSDVPPSNIPADIRSVFPLSAFNSEYQWKDAYVHSRRRHNSPRVRYPQGRVVGGTSAIMECGRSADCRRLRRLASGGGGWLELEGCAAGLLQDRERYRLRWERPRKLRSDTDPKRAFHQMVPLAKRTYDRSMSEGSPTFRMPIVTSATVTACFRSAVSRPRGRQPGSAI